MSVENALLDQELDPCLVAVQGEQRMVQIKKREHAGAHWTPTLAAGAAALPPEGVQFTPWGGPAAFIAARLECVDAAEALDRPAGTNRAHRGAAPRRARRAGTLV